MYVTWIGIDFEVLLALIHLLFSRCVYFWFYGNILLFSSWVNLVQPHYWWCIFSLLYHTHTHSLTNLPCYENKTCSDAMNVFLNLHEEKATHKKWERFGLISFWRHCCYCCCSFFFLSTKSYCFFDLLVWN